LELNAMGNYSADFMNWFRQVPQPPSNYFNWAAGIQDWLRRASQPAAQSGAAPAANNSSAGPNPLDDDEHALWQKQTENGAPETASSASPPDTPSDVFSQASVTSPADPTRNPLSRWRAPTAERKPDDFASTRTPNIASPSDLSGNAPNRPSIEENSPWGLIKNGLDDWVALNRNTFNGVAKGIDDWLSSGAAADPMDLDRGPGAFFWEDQSPSQSRARLINWLYGLHGYGTKDNPAFLEDAARAYYERWFREPLRMWANGLETEDFRRQRELIENHLGHNYGPGDDPEGQAATIGFTNALAGWAATPGMARAAFVPGEAGVSELGAFGGRRPAGSGPRLIGTFEPPANMNFGTTDFGKYAHEKAADILKSMHPNVPFIFRTKPFETGVDVTVPNKYITHVGFAHGEIKPLTDSGKRTMLGQVLKWGLDRKKVRAITYDAQGNVFYGFE
jgi:hypothetical protein